MEVKEIAKLIRRNIKWAANITPVEDGVKFTKNLKIFLIKTDLDCHQMNGEVRCRTKASEGLKEYIKNFL